MRLLLYKEGSFIHLTSFGAGLAQAADIEERLRKYVHNDGTISALSVLFEEVNIPLTHEAELHLVASLLAAEHNRHINAKEEVSFI